MTAATGAGRHQRDDPSQLFDSSIIKPPPHEAIYSYDSCGEENNFHDFVEVGAPSFSNPLSDFTPLEIHEVYSGEAYRCQFSRC
jgi:hypothetical protein